MDFNAINCDGLNNCNELIEKLKNERNLKNTFILLLGLFDSCHDFYKKGAGDRVSGEVKNINNIKTIYPTIDNIIDGIIDNIIDYIPSYLKNKKDFFENIDLDDKILDVKEYLNLYKGKVDDKKFKHEIFINLISNNLKKMDIKKKSINQINFELYENIMLLLGKKNICSENECEIKLEGNVILKLRIAIYYLLSYLNNICNLANNNKIGLDKKKIDNLIKNDFEKVSEIFDIVKKYLGDKNTKCKEKVNEILNIIKKYLENYNSKDVDINCLCNFNFKNNSTYPIGIISQDTKGKLELMGFYSKKIFPIHHSYFDSSNIKINTVGKDFDNEYVQIYKDNDKKFFLNMDTNVNDDINLNYMGIQYLLKLDIESKDIYPKKNESEEIYAEYPKKHIFFKFKNDKLEIIGKCWLNSVDFISWCIYLLKFCLDDNIKKEKYELNYLKGSKNNTLLLTINKSNNILNLIFEDKVEIISDKVIVDTKYEKGLELEIFNLDFLEKKINESIELNKKIVENKKNIEETIKKVKELIKNNIRLVKENDELKNEINNILKRESTKEIKRKKINENLQNIEENNKLIKEKEKEIDDYNELNKKILNLKEDFNIIYLAIFGFKRFGDWYPEMLARKNYLFVNSDDVWANMFGLVYGTPVVYVEENDYIVYNYIPPKNLIKEFEEGKSNFTIPNIDTDDDGKTVYKYSQDSIVKKDKTKEFKLIFQKKDEYKNNSEGNIVKNTSTPKDPPLSRYYFEKYLKYKNKYLELQKNIKKN